MKMIYGWSALRVRIRNVIRRLDHKAYHAAPKGQRERGQSFLHTDGPLPEAWQYVVRRCQRAAFRLLVLLSSLDSVTQ